MSTRRRLRIFLTVAAIHLCVSLLLLFYIFGSGMTRFDSGADAAALEIVARWLFATLSFPMLMVLERLPLRFPGWWGYLPFLTNSALWGAAVARMWPRV